MLDSHALFSEIGLSYVHDDTVQVLGETVGERVIYYRLGESEVFQYANQNTMINGRKLVDVIPLMVLPDQGFLQVEYNQLDKAVQYEIFEGPHYRLSCKKTIRDMIDKGIIQMVYSETYKIPTCIPYIIQGGGKVAKIYVNVSDYLQLDQYGKYQISRAQNYNALMAAIFSAAAAITVVRNNSKLPADLCDGMVLMYASMFERCLNSIVHMDPLTRDKVRYLAAEFALIQMYGTEDGQRMFFTRFKDKYFPKLSKLVTETIDAQFHTDCFDRISSFILELKRLYPSMKGLTEYLVYDKWIRLYGSSTAFSIDYLGYHLYTISMVLFESPLITRMALEPVMEKNKGAEMYRRLQMLIGD